MAETLLPQTAMDQAVVDAEFATIVEQELLETPELDQAAAVFAAELQATDEGLTEEERRTLDAMPSCKRGAFDDGMWNGIKR